MFIKFISSANNGEFDKFYSLYDKEGGRQIIDVHIATAHCCAMNMLSNFSYMRGEDWKMVKEFLSNSRAFMHKAYGGSLEDFYSTWKTKTFFLTIPDGSGPWNPAIYSFLRKDPDIKLVHSFTNHAHDGHQVGLYKLEF